MAVKEVTVTQKSTVSENLNKSVRVGVVYGTTAYIYCPLQSQYTASTPGYNTTGVTAKKAAGTSGEGESLTYTDLFTLTSNTIPANDDGIVVSVY